MGRLNMVSYFKTHWGRVGKGECNLWRRVYVVGKDMRERRAYVARGRGHPALFCDTAALRSPHWIGGDPPPQLASGTPLRCQYKARCGHCLSRPLPLLSQRSWSPSLCGKPALVPHNAPQAQSTPASSQLEHAKSPASIGFKLNQCFHTDGSSLPAPFVHIFLVQCVDTPWAI
jgi:hypothetical protein